MRPSCPITKVEFGPDKTARPVGFLFLRGGRSANLCLGMEKTVQCDEIGELVMKLVSKKFLKEEDRRLWAATVKAHMVSTMDADDQFALPDAYLRRNLCATVLWKVAHTRSPVLQHSRRASTQEAIRLRP